MGLRFWLALAAASCFGAAQAQASLAPGENIVGRWAPQPDCRAPGFSYVTTNDGVQHVVRDGERVYRTPVRIELEDDVVRVEIDEKIFTFRLPTRDTLQALRFTDTRNGLSAALRPRIWYRCGQEEE
ncbi:MAG: hypothetical protein WD470_02460 [Rhodospirillaceae bacterium]